MADLSKPFCQTRSRVTVNFVPNAQPPMQLLKIGLSILVCSIVAMSQPSNSDRCQVVILDITGRNISQLEDLSGKLLGSFDTVKAEEELTTKIYHLPKTSLFVVASVWYTDESIASEKGADSISLELLISKRPRRDIRRALHFSDSEVPVNGFDVARVSTLVKAQHKTIFVIMECRKPSPPNPGREELK